MVFQMESAFYESSDYGSDFTADEEEILSELLARVDQSSASSSQRTQTASASVGDIEDYNKKNNYYYNNIDELPLPPACSPEPKVLGREKKSMFPWTRRTQTGEQQVARRMAWSKKSVNVNTLSTVLSFSLSLTTSLFILCIYIMPE